MPNAKRIPDVSFVGDGFRVHIKLDRFSKQFAAAQQWLGDRVLEDCKPFMPFLTGGLQQRSHTENDGAQVVFPGPYARFLYGGKVMVDPVTGSPWARKGAKKVLTDRSLQYSQPLATDHWFDEAQAQHGEYWIKEVKKMGGGGA